MSGPSTVETYVEPSFACEAVSPVVVAVWRGAPTPEAIARAMRVLERCAARVGGPWAYLTIVEPTSPPPSASVRAEIEAHLDSYRDLSAVVAVLEGRPPWLGHALDAALAIASPRVHPRAAKICVDVQEAITWLERRQAPALHDGFRPALDAALVRMRAALPPP